jgi:uncharacterized protein
MKNPFRYGIAVDDPYFVDREQEMSDFSKWLTSGQSLVIYSPRRYGKTSLMLKLLKELRRKGFYIVYVDFFKVNSRLRFAELYYSEIIKQLPAWQKNIKKILSLTKSVRPVVSLDQQGFPTVSINLENKPGGDNLSELFDLPVKLNGGKRWIIVFDEFQEINNLNGESFEKEMRASFIHHSNVGYVFMGSKMHMLLNMFTHENSAFYQFGKIIELGKLQVDALINYLEKKFRNTKINFDEEIPAKIIELCEAIPHYVQYLASGAWEEAIENHSRLDKKILEKAVSKIITNQNDYFITQYENLTTHQQKVLKAISIENKNIFTSGFTERHHLSAFSSVQRSLERLLKSGIILKQSDQYLFTDPFFKRWLETL